MTAHHLCQLAGSWAGTLPAWSIGEQKVDGFRALWLRDREGRPRLFSRNGFDLPGTEHIAHELMAFERHAGHRLFIDGEFVVGETGDTLATTKRWVESGHKLGGTAGTFYAFDCLPYDDWYRGGTDQPWFQRKARLEQLSLSVASDAEHQWTWRQGARGDEPCPVRVVPHADVWTVDDAVQMASEMWAAGLEGIVLKDAESSYQRNRNPAWLKVGRPWQSKLGWRIAA